MSFAEMKGQVGKLSAEERQELMTLLYALQEAETPEYKRKMAEILDDPNPDRWIAIEDLDAFFAEKDREAKRQPVPSI
jgi:hypothetical protein